MVVDWSAAAVPRRGADSIWIADYGVASGAVQLENPPTRQAASDGMLARCQAALAAGERLLIGCDFSFGFPVGMAAALGWRGDGPAWRFVWDALAAELIDQPDNGNNRFALAAAWNRRISGRAEPFWGCPPSAVDPGGLAPRRQGDGGLPARRQVETLLPRLQPVWKLYTTGSVGSQSLTGIPRLRWLRDHPALAPWLRLWPQETGLCPPDPGVRIVLAEIFPSLLTPPPLAGLPKDAAQVTALARWLAQADLDRLFAVGAVSPALRQAAEGEEGWVLGVTAKTPFSAG